MCKRIKPKASNLWIGQLSLLLALLGFWHISTAPGLIPPMMCIDANQAGFFFGEPLGRAQVITCAF